MTRNTFLKLFFVFLLSLFLIPTGKTHAQLSSIDVSTTPFSNALGPNNTVYVATFDCGCLDVFDFTDKSNPVLLSHTEVGVATSFVSSYGNYAYVSNYQGQVITFDMTDPTAPVLVNTYSFPDGNGTGISRIYGNHLFVNFGSDGRADRGGVGIFDLTDPSNPTLISQIILENKSESGGNDVSLVGNVLYVADYFGYALSSYDISDISNPVSIQNITGITDANNYKVINGTGFFEPWMLLQKDNALYLMDDDIIQVYDISSSTNMVYSKTIVAQKDIEGAEIRGNILYYSSSFDSQLSYYDITDALNPTLITTVSNDDGVSNHWLTIDGDGYYYVSSRADNNIYVFEPLKIIKSYRIMHIVKESGQKTYSLRLSQAPTDDVQITLSTTTSALEPCLAVSPTSLTFTPSNWNVAQIVTAQSLSTDDGCTLGSEIYIHTSASSSDPYYNNALVSDIKAVIYAGFITATGGNWNNGHTWGNGAGGTAGIDYPGATSSATILYPVQILENTSVDHVNVVSGFLRLNGFTFTVFNSFINSAILYGDAIFLGGSSYNNGTVVGNPTFASAGYNKPNGIVNGDATFSNSGYNFGTVNGTSTFVGDIITATGTTTGNIIRKYTSSVTTTRNFTTENGHSNWTVIADGALVDISSSTYATSTNIFKAINGGGFYYGANAGGPVVPDVSITAPVSSSTVAKWSPVVSWGDSTSCYYSYNNFATTSAVTCSNNGSDIIKPSSAGTSTLYVRGVNSAGSLTEKRVTFIYNNTAAIPTICGSDLLDEPTRPYYYLEGNITANCTATTNVELRGASSTNVTGFTLTGNVIASATSSANGFNLTLKNITVTGTITSNGANGGSTGYNGGTITISTSTTGSITSNGGNGNVTGGNGGVITITNSFEISTSTSVSAQGGNATVCGRGGSGGTVTLIGSTYNNININAGSDQTVIGAGLCSAPPSGSSGSTGSQIIHSPYTPPSNNNTPGELNQQTPSTPSVGQGSGTTGSTISLLNNKASSTVPVINSQINQDESKKSNTPILESIKQIVKGTTDVVNSPASKAVQTVGFFAGLIGAISLYLNAMFATPLLASELLLIPVRLWGLLMMGFGLRKRTPPWGTVYDSVTKQPIDPAFVTVRDMNGNVVAQSITDIDGRYGFFLPDGTYKISAEKTNYEFPSKKLNGKVADEIYRDLYFGEDVIVKSGEIIDKNIPLDQLNFDWNEAEKNDQNLMVFHKKKEKLFRRISDYVFKIGAAISVITVIINPSTYNIIILGIYILVQVLLHFGIKGKKLGYIRDRNTGKPFSYAIFRVTALDHQTVLRSGVCDAQGRYYCIVPKGQYYLDVEKKNRDGSYTKVFQSDLLSSTNGILNKDFAI